MFGRKNHFIDIIKYEGPQDVFIWKHEAEDFNTKTQLIVHESEEAIFFRNGQALDSFPPGRYTLDTQNIPLIRRFVGLATGGVTPFHCQVYFINKAISMGITWGTDAPIVMIDPEYGVEIRMTAYGDFSLRVEDGRMLLVKLAGSGVKTYTHEEIQKYFANIMAAHIRDTIATVMERDQISAMRLNTQLLSFSRDIKAQLEPVFAEYGLQLNHFIVSNVSYSGLEEINSAIKTGKVKRVVAYDDADVARTKIDVEAERISKTGAATEVQREAFAVGKILAENRGPEVTAAGSPLFGGVHMAVQSPAGAASEIVKTAIGRDESAASDLRTSSGRKARLKELKELFEDGLITEEAYREKQAEVLKNL